QLQPIRRAQRVPLQGAHSVGPHGLTGENLRPGGGKASKNSACVLFIIRIEDAVAPQTREGGPALDHAAPPHQHQRILSQHLGEQRSPGFIETQPHDGGRIPEYHRPASRSSSSTCRPSPWGSLGRGSVQTSSGTRPEPCLTNPACSRAVSAASGAANGAAIGTIFAIGVPRSVTTTSSPALTQAKHAWRVAFNWDINV